MKTAHTTELVIPATDHESRTRCTAVAAKTRSVLATCTNPEECVYVHAELVGLLALLGEVGPSLQEAAPLIQTNGVDMAQVQARVAERQRREEEEFQRQMNFWAAYDEVERAAKTYGEVSPQVSRAKAKAIEFLPPAGIAELNDLAYELGLVPKPAGYTADNEPVFAVADLARHLGLDESEIHAIGDGDSSLAVDASCVHHVQ